MTIICSAVGLEPFLAVADDVVAAMLEIQDRQLETKDTQRLYLLSAWQRICLLMKDKFVKYLPRVLKGIFEMAALNPKMGVSGSDTVAALTDVLNEINEGANAGEPKAAQNIVTDEIEEKEVGI
jgi:hypothetical protein